MIDLKRYESLKKEVERCRTEKARAEGALSQTMNKIREEFGCENIQEAKEKLVALEKEAVELEGRWEKALGKFEARWRKH